MNSDQITTSAALYFDRTEIQSIPLHWLERARAVFVEYDLSPILFTASGGDFEYDDGYVLAEHGNDVSLWGELFLARSTELVQALREGGIKDLGLDSPCPGAGSRSDWWATIDISLVDGIFHIGINDQFVADPTTLLRRAYGIIKEIFSIRYGIAYKMPLAQEPDCYASGVVPNTFAEVREMIRHRDGWEYRKRTADEHWRDELHGEKRHLTGLFRGAYPASILSNSHLETAALSSRGIGRLSELDDTLWLWELSDSEVNLAESVLEARRALVRQTT